MLYPKPPKKPKKRGRRNSVPTINDLCEVCGSPYAATHEIFFGSKHRQLSIRYGLTKRLCYPHHNMPGGINPHFNRELDLRYKREYQEKFESEHGHDLFMELFKRSYL